MIRILCIESSTEVCSVAIVEDGKVVDFREDLNGLNHSKVLTVFIGELLIANNLKATDFNAVAVSEGPGSYTGLRIGVSVAKGFCYGSGISLIAISPLKAMAHFVINSSLQFEFNFIESDLFVPMIDARRMEVYCSTHNFKTETLAEVDALIINSESFNEQLSKYRLFFFGNGAGKCSEIIKSPNAHFVPGIYSSARNMAELAHQKYLENDFVNVAYFEPFYLKDFVAIKSTKNAFGL